MLHPGPLGAPLEAALRALLAPIVVVSAIAGLLLGLQRNYLAMILTMRSLNRRRREGDRAADVAFHGVHRSACTNARAIATLYAAIVALLLAACTTGAALLLSQNTDRQTIVAVLAWGSLLLFVAGILATLSALFALLRDV
ncbi:MAG TPA: hypothetical protein VF719_13100, partial [Abditibacteriaceae bacterium]